MSWNDERVETLKRLAADGQSASYIAAAIGGGLTRNAVIGKAHRMGIDIGRQKGYSPETRRKFLEKGKPRLVKALVEANGHRYTGKYAGQGHVVQQRQLERAIAVADTAPPEALMVSLLDLEPHHCRWPIGDPSKPGFGFCGCQKAPVGSYCTHHAQMAVREVYVSPEAGYWGSNMRKRFAAA